MIKIHGEIGWDVDAYSVVREILQSTGDIAVDIASIGGLISDGIEIFNALDDYDRGTVTITVSGECMSIASYIAMAGDTLEVKENSIFMMHSAWKFTAGNATELKKQAEHLDAVTNILAIAYAEKSGKTIDEILVLLEEETFLYGSEIVEAGFADTLKSGESNSTKSTILAKAKDDFKVLSKKLDSKKCGDINGACKLLNIRTEQMKQFENKLKNSKKEENMPENIKKIVDDEATKALATSEKELSDAKAQNNELVRMSEVDAVAIKYGASDSELYATFRKKGDAKDFAIAILEKKGNPTPIHQEKDKASQKKEMLMAMSDGLAIRMGARIREPHADSSKYANASLLAIARHLTGASEFEAPSKVASDVLAMGTGDFPILLSNVANKVLMDSWEEEPTTYQHWCGESDVPDFKENTFAHLGGFGNLEKLYERGELKNSKLKESAEKGSIGSKGLIVTLSREAIINDDLGAFIRVVQGLAQSARRTLNADVYTAIQGTTYKMSDNKAIFHADHKNVASAGSAISGASLTDGELMMMEQTGLNGETLNLSPFFLITGAATYRQAKQVLASTSEAGTDSNSGVVNTWNGGLSQIKDGNISGNQWFLAGKNNTVRVMFLSGTGRKPIIEMSNIGVGGVEYTVVFDYGIIVDNFRTMFKNGGE